MEEMFDTYTRDGKYLDIRSKSFCHGKDPGVYHKSVYVWAINKNGEVLIQRRALCKKHFPGKWDISIAGHIHAGELPIDACVRETKEELGIDVPKDNFEFITDYIYDTNYEILQIYFLYIDKEYEFKLDNIEVEQVKYVSIEEFIKTFYTDLFPPHNDDYKEMIINLLKEKIKNKTQE